MNPTASHQIELLRKAYLAFNDRQIDSALELMTATVNWPKAFKGGFTNGHEELRAYWTEQWNEIDPKVEPIAFHPESPERLLVEVHQIVRDLEGKVLVDLVVGHRFTFDGHLIRKMELREVSQRTIPN